MKLLSALFLGMGIGYMNMGGLLFLIPMGIGILFYIFDEINNRSSKP